MATECSSAAGEILFGPFRLLSAERLLLRDDAAVELGSRALDLLIALATRPNELISKRDLIAQVWPDVVVEEASLRFHIAALRKALGDGTDGARFITTLPGRGYCFVAKTSVIGESGRAQTSGKVARSNVLPRRLLRMVGRAEGVRAVSMYLTAQRFVTITGAGGVGKTTIAVAVANDLTEAFSGDVLFVELGALKEPHLAATTLATILGLSVQSDDPTPNLVAYLRDKSVLLIFDNCEHVIDAIAGLAAQIYAASPRIHILATSREALRVEGEHVYRLDPLLCPPDESGLTVDRALTFPAIQLFVERCEASGAELALSDVDARTIAAICRKLDGVALAIEFAASRVGAYGLHQTAALLGERLSLLWQGQRSAPARQQTLRATLDWSYGLLTDAERQVLRRLAVFAGDFTIEAVVAVATSKKIEQALVFSAIESLVAKSMVANNQIGDTTRYRLLDPTRVYALEASDDDEYAAAAARHASYYQKWLGQSGGGWQNLAHGAERALHLADIANVRSALEWCFGERGNPKLGVDLAAAAAPVFVAMSSFTESRRWSERAIMALDATNRGGQEEMSLQAALGVSLMFLQGQGEAAAEALHRSLAIAHSRGDAVTQMQVMAPLVMFNLRIGEFRRALEFGERASWLSRELADPGALALAHSLLGISLTHTGNLELARSELEAAQHVPGFKLDSANFLGFDGHDLAGVFLARTLWLQGYPDQAMERVHLTVAHAALVDHPVTLSIALVWAVSVFMWLGDLENAEKHIDWFVARAETHSLGPYHAVGRGYKGQLAVRRGDYTHGIENLRSSLADLHVVRYELLTTAFTITLVEGLAALRRFDEAIGLVDEAIKMVEMNGDASYMPELLRVKGNVLLKMGLQDPGEALLMQALDLSRRQAAMAWELRIGTDLAACWSARGQGERARGLLAPIVDRFEEGQGSADIKAAALVLTSLR